MAVISIPLTPEQYDFLTRPITGDPKSWGGFQRLLHRFQENLSTEGGERILSVTLDDLDRAIRYCTRKYGPGGFQERLRPLEPALRAAWHAAPKGPTLFDQTTTAEGGPSLK